jgi:hypothetical protein
VCFIDRAEKYKTMTLRDHRQEKKKNSPRWIGTSTRVTAQLYALAGWIETSTRPQLYTQRRQQNKAEPHLPSQPSHTSIETIEAKTAADRGWRGRHQCTTTPKGLPPRGTQRPVLLHPNWPPGGMQTPSQKQTLACAGTSNPPLNTPLSLSCAGTAKPAARLHASDSSQG